MVWSYCDIQHLLFGCQSLMSNSGTYIVYLQAHIFCLILCANRMTRFLKSAVRGLNQEEKKSFDNTANKMDSFIATLTIVLAKIMKIVYLHYSTYSLNVFCRSHNLCLWRDYVFVVI